MRYTKGNTPWNKGTARPKTYLKIRSEGFNNQSGSKASYRTVDLTPDNAMKVLEYALELKVYQESNTKEV